MTDIEDYFNNAETAAPVRLDGKTQTKLTGTGPGHNAWMMTSTALVLMMTLPRPGSVLWRSGSSQERVVRVRPVFRYHRLGDDLWYFVGYSLVFSNNNGAYWAGVGYSPLGDLTFWKFNGAQLRPLIPNYSYWVSQDVFACFQADLRDHHLRR